MSLLDPKPNDPIIPYWDQFKTYYSPTHHVRVLRHNNGVLIVQLSYGHELLKSVESTEDHDSSSTNPNLRTITKVKFRDINQVSGKRKRGGTYMQMNSRLCEVTYADKSKQDPNQQGEEHRIDVRMPVEGVILELNKKLESDPALLLKRHGSAGYVAIIMPKAASLRSAGGGCDHLVSEEEYRKLVIEKGNREMENAVNPMEAGKEICT